LKQGVFFVVVFDIIPAGTNSVKIRNVKSGLFIAIDQNGDVMTKVWVIYISFYPLLFISTFASMLNFIVYYCVSEMCGGCYESILL
jgi:hypothetical protein